jgi:peptide deformylase
VAVRRIRIYGDPVLRQKAAAVADFDASVVRLVTDLRETLTDAGGVGLAAPQIGVGLRAFVYGVVDPESPDVGTIQHIINPVIVEEDPEQIEDEEGCLSIPGVNYDVRRSRRVVAIGYDCHGEPLRIEGTERLARCLAHETDHLDGVMFIDRLDPERRKQAMREIRQMLLEGETVHVKASPHQPLM